MCKIKICNNKQIQYLVGYLVKLKNSYKIKNTYKHVLIVYLQLVCCTITFNAYIFNSFNIMQICKLNCKEIPNTSYNLPFYEHEPIKVFFL